MGAPMGGAMGEDWPYEADRSIRDGLWPGEELLWVGHAAPHHTFVSGDGCRIPFMIAWTGFAVFWTLAALAGGAGFFALFGLGFVGIGTYGLIGPNLARRKLPGNTAYAITNRRAIVRSTKGTSAEVPIEQVNPVITWSSDQRMVTVQLSPTAALAQARTNNFSMMGSPTARMGPTFLDVEDGHAMLQALDYARAGAYRGYAPQAPPPPPTWQPTAPASFGAAPEPYGAPGRPVPGWPAPAPAQAVPPPAWPPRPDRAPDAYEVPPPAWPPRPAHPLASTEPSAEPPAEPPTEPPT